VRDDDSEQACRKQIAFSHRLQSETRLFRSHPRFGATSNVLSKLELSPELVFDGLDGQSKSSAFTNVVHSPFKYAETPSGSGIQPTIQQFSGSALQATEPAHFRLQRNPE
jgi:hypothetical protein